MQLRVLRLGFFQDGSSRDPSERCGSFKAYVMTGDAAKSRGADQDFLTLWKDADPDVPILKEAKAEYAKLH